MPGEKWVPSGQIYLRIVDGNFVQKVEEGTKDSRCRSGKLKDGTLFEVHELVYKNWTGLIHGITIEDGKYGEECKLELEDAIITLPTSGRYFSDLACRLFSANLEEPIKFHPYNMEDDAGKVNSGVSMSQAPYKEANKLKSFFYDGEKNLHGFPEPDKKRMDKKAYWQVFFAEVAMFLVERLEKLKFPERVKAVEDVDTGEGDPDDEEVERAPAPKAKAKPKTKKVMKTKEEAEEELDDDDDVPKDLPWEK